MESAKKAVGKFLHRAGKHETDVQRHVAEPVKHENIERQQHEEVTTVVDKEIHQDHYHTTVQPITDTEVLPEQHHYRVAPAEHREFEHGDVSDVQRKLHAEASNYQDGTTYSEGAATSTAASTVGTTHVHHHIHETVQPILEKKVIERHIIHTTVPVHETHHNPAEHHDTSTLPVVSMDQYQRSSGASVNRDTRSSTSQSLPQSTTRTLASNGLPQVAQPAQTTANSGVTRNVRTGVAENAALNAARAAAMGPSN